MNEENERSITLGDLLTAVKKNILMVLKLVLLQQIKKVNMIL